MTTLPQTSPLRLPRPGGTSIASIPMGPVGPVGFAPVAPQASGLSGGDVMRVLRSNAWLIIITLVIAGGAGYGINTWLAARHTRFTSTGYLAMLSKGDMPKVDSSDYTGEASAVAIEMQKSDAIVKLKHPSLATRLLSNVDSPIRQTQWFRQFATTSGGKILFDVDAAQQDLSEHLDVAPITGSRLISVAMTYSNPRDCQTIVSEVCNQYIRDMQEMETEAQAGRAAILESFRNNYDTSLHDTRARINKIIDELGQGGANIGTGTTGSKEFELQALATELTHAQSNVIDTALRLQRFKEVSSKPDFTLPEIEEQIQHDQIYNELRHNADDVQLSLEQMQEKWGPSNNQVVSLKSRADALQQKSTEVHEEIRVRLMNSYQFNLESAAMSAKSSFDLINGRINELRGQLSQLAGKRSEYERLQIEEHDLSIKLANIKSEQDKMATLNGSGKIAMVQWATYPEIPTIPSFPKLSLTLSMALMLGLALSVGIAFLREITDTSVRSPRDIARIGNLSLLGMIPHESDDPQSAGARLPLAIFEAPYSMVAEQFRQVRTRLQHAASLDTTRSILVTGCSPGDGKSTVACNLAAGLALNGRRILLVDANFRRPELHNIFNIPNDAGFGDVLNAPDQFDELVRDTEVPNLAVLVAGQRPSNPTELLESQLLIDFTERALEEYDHVIFDSGPLLIVSESNALAPRVDGVITVVRAQGNSRGLLQRMRDQLRVLKAEHLGVILNAVRSQGGGYYGPMIKSYYAYGNPQ